MACQVADHPAAAVDVDDQRFRAALRVGVEPGADCAARRRDLHIGKRSRADLAAPAPCAAEPVEAAKGEDLESLQQAGEPGLDSAYHVGHFSCGVRVFSGGGPAVLFWRLLTRLSIRKWRGGLPCQRRKAQLKLPGLL